MLQFPDPEILNMEKKFLDQEILEMVQFLDSETAEILQFLDPEIVKMDKKFLDPEIVEMVRFLDPEIVEKVDKSYIKVIHSHILARACGIPVGWRSGGRLAMTLMATINVIIFFFFFFFLFFFFFFFLSSLLFSKKECSDQKTYLAKVA